MHAAMLGAHSMNMWVLVPVIPLQAGAPSCSPGPALNSLLQGNCMNRMSRDHETTWSTGSSLA